MLQLVTRVLRLRVEGQEKLPPNLPLKGEGFFRTCITPAFLVSYWKIPVGYDLFLVNYEATDKPDC